MLVDVEILNAIKDGCIKISDFDEKRLNPNSYNLRLDKTLYIYKTPILSCRHIYADNDLESLEISETGSLLMPGTLYLGKTVEHTETHEHVPLLEGRSSLARLGLSVHVTAGFGDIGFCGCWTLELSVVQPLLIFPYVEVCQISYHKVRCEPRKKYVGKYQNAKTVMPSKMGVEL